LFEFGRRDFAETFEAGNLARLAEFGGGLIAFGFGVTIDRLLFVADAEERRLEDLKVAIVDELIEEAEEIGDEQVANVEPVNVGVRREDDFFVAQAFEVVLDVEAAHEVIHLVVFIDDVAFEVPDVEWFAFEDEDGLVVDVAATDD